jgi:hypothetical protein
MIKILGVNLMANFNIVDWMLICVVLFALRGRSKRRLWALVRIFGVL